MKRHELLPLFLLALAAAFTAQGASVGFAYARPFRTGLNVDKEITNILDKVQQPLTDESWGVQAKLKFDKYDSGIDTNRGFCVYLRYYKGDSPWGYDRWKDVSGASAWAKLVQVGERGDYVFRSTVADPATIVPPTAEANTAVQYMVRVEYYLKGVAEAQSALIGPRVEDDGWASPVWYEPIDYNESDLYGNGEHFSPYTILDGVSPGRVWINEVNYCDGPKAQNGDAKCVTNQFIEVAVPWGVDLAGWRVVLTDYNHTSLTIAELGKNGVPTSKKSTDGKRSGDYDFLVLQSPKTRDAGGIRDSETGLPAADCTWSSGSLQGTFIDGSLQYDLPYQLELFRPSGILEHQFVVAGTNEWREPSIYYKQFGYQFDGTNLLNKLNEADPSAKRFYAGEDLARKSSDEAVRSSLGVTGGAHGEVGGWTSEMKFTPGRVNEGQDELVNWFLKPPPVVSNVVARQRWPWNGLVDVDYDVSGNTAGLKAEIAFVEQGGESRTWTATKFAEGFAPSAEPGHHRATWDTKADGATNIVAKVKAVVKLVVVPVEYPLWVGGVQVWNTNSVDVLGDGGTVSYVGNAAHGRLTLSDAKISNGYLFNEDHNFSACIYSGLERDLEIVIKGSNRLDSAHSIVFGIESVSDLQIRGGGMLVADVTGNFMEAENLCVDGTTLVGKGGLGGISASGDLAFSNANVRVVCSGGGSGIHGEGIASIANSTVDATGAAEGIAIDGELTISGASTVTAYAGVAPETDDRAGAIIANSIEIESGLAVTFPAEGEVRAHESYRGQTIYAQGSEIPARKVVIE